LGLRHSPEQLDGCLYWYLLRSNNFPKSQICCKFPMDLFRQPIFFYTYNNPTEFENNISYLIDHNLVRINIIDNSYGIKLLFDYNKALKLLDALKIQSQIEKLQNYYSANLKDCNDFMILGRWCFRKFSFVHDFTKLEDECFRIPLRQIKFSDADFIDFIYAFVNYPMQDNIRVLRFLIIAISDKDHRYFKSWPLGCKALIPPDDWATNYQLRQDYANKSTFLITQEIRKEYTNKIEKWEEYYMEKNYEQIIEKIEY
jgi:hypothetical protein